MRLATYASVTHLFRLRWVDHIISVLIIGGSRVTVYHRIMNYDRLVPVLVGGIDFESIQVAAI